MNYYDLLNVKENASHDEIKKSFRKKLKEHHPDMHEFKKGEDGVTPKSSPNYTGHASVNLVHIIDAYAVLSNPIKRKQYDERRDIIPFAEHENAKYASKIKRRNKKVFDYEKFLLARQDKWEYQVKYFLYDLVFRNGDQAKKVYERLEKENKISNLRKTLGYLDYFDCMFLMAEYYQNHGSIENSNKAMLLFFEIGNMERERPYFKSYMEEVADRIFILIQSNRREHLNIEYLHSLLNNMKDWPILKTQKKKIEKILMS